MKTHYVVRKIADGNIIRTPESVPLGIVLEPDYDQVTGILTYYPMVSSKPRKKVD